MSLSFEERLNRILPRITSDDFLHNRGLGNEIGFWIFDYPPERELEMRAFVREVVEPALAKRTPAIRAHNLNLFELIIDLLKERGLLAKALRMQVEKGNDATARSLRSVLKEDKVAKRIADTVDLSSLDLLLLTGVGAAYPLVRTSTLLSALHPAIPSKPLLMFYPGRYDGFSLHLFGKLSDSQPDPYYRAFRLVD